MIEFPKDIKFKYSWRKYQQRVLDELESHLEDDHLHVIAPPGSGKTVLGLEVAIRLNKPTLVLAPTIAIRNQWVQRFCELFLTVDKTPDWISRDIRNPRFLTVITYQGLHAACNNVSTIDEVEEEEEIIDEAPQEETSNQNLDAIVIGLKDAGIKTIVIDEAHHLKNEWWQTLTKVKEAIEPRIVGLTATPPYDVTASEWQRYVEINGPVDTEISVPELILEGDLCPHQDYVYLSLPTEKESTDILQFRSNIEKLFAEIKKDETLIRAIESHPIWIKPMENLDWIYSNLSYYSASLIFLNSIGKVIPETHLEIIGDKNHNIPQLDYEWIETLLTFYLYKEKDHFKPFEEHRKSLENKLRRYGVIEKKQIRFSHNPKVAGFLASSISKLNGIKQIVDFEYKQLGHDLRLVILSDFIRKEFFVNQDKNAIELNKIGILPIFEKLRRENSKGIKIGVLTGSIVILPRKAYSTFENKAKQYGINNIQTNDVPFDNDYIVINQSEQLKHDIVHIVTQIFQDGEIEVLIGTKSLLGEGWDAPAINTLILASFVGSFVLSNQMRGRAIRVQKENVTKTGNIWHLVCIDSTSKNGGDDLELLKRRFKGFVGISFGDNPNIENGTGRLQIPANINSKESVDIKNSITFKYAADRKLLKSVWEKALSSGKILVEEIKIPFPEGENYKALKSLYFNRTIAYLVGLIVSGLGTFAFQFFFIFLKSLRFLKNPQNMAMILVGAAILGLIAFGSLLAKTLRLYLKYRDIAKDIKNIGDALLKTLIKVGAIQTEESKLRVEATVDSEGFVYCHLEGGNTFDKSTFVLSLQEIIGLVDNPRYVIIRKNRLILLIKQKDFHSVPEVIGKKKEFAEYLQNQWTSLVGDCELVFTRNIEGRKLLLKSRIKSLSAQFENKIEHVNKWR